MVQKKPEKYLIFQAILKCVRRHFRWVPELVFTFVNCGNPRRLHCNCMIRLHDMWAREREKVCELVSSSMSRGAALLKFSGK
jgi:hypothetical protein